MQLLAFQNANNYWQPYFLDVMKEVWGLISDDRAPSKILDPLHESLTFFESTSPLEPKINHDSVNRAGDTGLMSLITMEHHIRTHSPSQT